MSATITFDPDAFLATFPEFASSTSPARCTLMFGLASGAILDNTGAGPVQDSNVLTNLFYLLVAHLLLIFGTADAPIGDNRPPGRLSSATEGTITNAFEYQIPQGSSMSAWFNQTKYGAMYWMATALYRSARYFASGNSGIGRAQAYDSVPFYLPGGV